jgi:hypothetical protein
MRFIKNKLQKQRKELFLFLYLTTGKRKMVKEIKANKNGKSNNGKTN